uniref:Spectrin repeat containing, nuclear envelope 2b n=1 Tax=Sphaeramia orbicularis TaxID=375764 RepID=A0A673AAZ1_9TELE
MWSVVENGSDSLVEQVTDQCHCVSHRVRKLKETLVTVQQLDKNMSNLRTWLSRIEAELAKPVVYNVCHSDEIQRKLAEQQDLQRDIEQHTESVASVLTLCDVLLHDADACGSDSENDSIQQTTRSLDRRWRNICAMSMERRMRIEETWRLWCKFLDDYSRFEDWLKTAELTAASPDSAGVLYTNAKEELKKFEAFQRQVHERLTQLELVNKQYRRLARENRTDAASKLKVMVHEGNQRWDGLQRRVAAVLRRLKHFTSQREDFEGTREGILVWLTEMDLQLTNVEHFSESDIEDKMRQLNGFQQEITLNTNKIDAPHRVRGEPDPEKSFNSYCQEVFGRVARFHHRLVNRRPEEEEEEGSAVGGATAGRQVMVHLLAPPLERSGRETPVSVDSIPLEWDHTVDVGGSSSHEDDEDATYFSALSDKNVTQTNQCTHIYPNIKLYSDSIVLYPRPLLEKKHLNSTCPHTFVHVFSSAVGVLCLFDETFMCFQVKLMSECSGSIDSVKKVKLILNDDEELDDPGLSCSVIQRWELIQAQKLSNAADIQQDLEQWQKLNSDLCDVTSWLGRVLPELDRLQRIAPSTSVRDIEVNIRKHKEMQKLFNSYKCLMISVNLSSRQFLCGDSVELRELRDALSSANHSWTQACGALERWERRLHSALMQCQEFHETLHSLLLWLVQAENKLKILSLLAPLLQEDLRSRQRQVSSLQDISSQLLVEATGDDSVEAKEKVHVIANKLRLLLRQTASDLQLLHARLVRTQRLNSAHSTGSPALTLSLKRKRNGRCCLMQNFKSAQVSHGDQAPPAPAGPAPPPSPPLLLFSLLLLLLCLLPLSEHDYSCTLSNNFARSFYPMLRYTNGPPPT